MAKYYLKHLILFIFTNSQIVAQGISNNWILGYWPIPLYNAASAKGKIDFYSGSAVVSPFTTKMPFRRTQANISDANGNLLMSSNGIFVANALGDTMQNGAGLSPDPYHINNYSISGLKLPNSNLILPFPDDSSKYILFHQSILMDSLFCCNMKLYYSIIDMNLDGGKGALIQKNILLPLPRLSGGLAACKHANGRDWWILAVQDTSNVIWKFLLTPQGIVTITSQTFPTILTNHGNSSQSCFSPDGTHFAFSTGRWDTSLFQWVSYIRYFNFNRCSGVLSEQVDIPYPDTEICWGLCFSPNSQYLFASSKHAIFQINSTAVNIAASIDTVALYDGFVTPPGNYSNEFDMLYLAGDGIIYASTYSGTLNLHRINYPDSAGMACNVEQHILSIPCYNGPTAPNHPNYFLGADSGSVCDTLLGVKNKVLNRLNNSLKLFPNPVQDVLSLTYTPSEKSKLLEVYNVDGKLVLTCNLPAWSQMQNIDVSDLPDGLYLCKLHQSPKFNCAKFVKSCQ